MYNTKDIQFAGKHDFDGDTALKYADNCETFSINIFRWDLMKNGKEMKKSKGLVRVKGSSDVKEKVVRKAESIVRLLDGGNWDSKKNVTVK